MCIRDSFESDPHPGDLRHLVEIGYTENTVNENGYPEPNDIVVCRTWASVCLLYTSRCV